MFRFILQKILNKKWLILCIVIGNILLVGISCCNPMYSQAALQKMLTKEMNSYLVKNNKNPGLLTLDAKLSNTMLAKTGSHYFDDYLTVPEKVEEMMGIKPTEQISLYEVANAQDGKFKVKRSGLSSIKLRLASMSGLEDHVEILSGEMYHNTIGEDGIIDCIINERVYLDATILIGDILEMSSTVNQNKEPIKIRVVGVFRAKDTTDPYWVNDPLSYRNEFFMAQDIFVDQFMKNGTIAGNLRAYWYTLYNYEDIKVEQVPQMLKVYKDLKADQDDYECLYSVKGNYADIFEQFLADSSKVNATMWILQVPILVLLAVFIFMVSNQIIGIEQGEIAMLKSRGVSRLQLILTYLIQSAILGVIALIVGIPLGYLLCHVFGSTNAFLEFVGRKAMHVVITKEALLYALISCVAGILIMTLPVLKFARYSIVEQKTNKRKKNRPMWQRMFLDIMLLLLALYGYYDFNNQRAELMKAVANGEAVNPMLFFSASLFILSCAIVFLRVIPLISSVLFRIGRRFWSPASYASFLQITRDSHKQSFITVFLVLTIALGIFNANIARTVNQNEEERIAYTDGADLVVSEQWKSNAAQIRNGSNAKLAYTEPDFTKYEKLAETESTHVLSYTKVINENNAKGLIGGKELEDIHLMAVNTYEFGHTAIMPDGVTEHHWFEDLNALASNPEGVIISSNLSESYDIKVGDTFVVERVNEVGVSMGTKSFTVVAVVDYWPNYENQKEGKDETGAPAMKPVYLAVCNYDNLLLDYPVTPYEVWIKTDGRADFFYNWAEENKVNITSYSDRAADVVSLKNNPYFQITNGMLTLTFIVVLVLCAIGFLIFWITSIRSRELIFGIYRAMGMSMGELIRMLINEHFFGSVLPILFGVGVGILASKLFIPLIQIAYSPKIETLPAKTVMSGSDLTQIGIVVAVMLFVCITVISILLSKIKINQALKLGED